jgi:hypothetical protein
MSAFGIRMVVIVVFGPGAMSSSPIRFGRPSKLDRLSAAALKATAPKEF